MRAKDRREMLGWLIGFAAGLQAMADCILLKVPDNITPIVAIIVIVVVGVLSVKGLDRLAELTRKPGRRHRKVRMYTIGPEKGPAPEDVLVEIRREA